MEETPKENMTWSGCGMELDEKNTDNVNKNQIDDDNDEQRRLATTVSILTKLTPFCWKQFLNWFIDQTIHNSSFSCPHLSILLGDGIQESPRLCHEKQENRNYWLCFQPKKHISLQAYLLEELLEWLVILTLSSLPNFVSQSWQQIANLKQVFFIRKE